MKIYMQKKQIVLYLGYSALILLALYFASGLLKIGGEGLASLGYSGDSLKEGFGRRGDDDDKQEKKDERLQKKFQEHVERNEKEEEHFDKMREELNRVEGMPEYQDIIDHYKDVIELMIRQIMVKAFSSGSDLMKSVPELNKYQTLLKALDMAGGGGGGGGAASKAGGYF